MRHQGPRIRKACARAVLAIAAAGMAGCATIADRPPAEEGLPAVDEIVNKGDAAYRRGEYRQALSHYVRALVNNPESPDVLYKIGTVHRQTDELALAEKAFLEVLELRPQDSAALEGLGLVYLSKRQEKPAEEMLLRALNQEPTRWRTLNALGILADLSGDLARAQSYYEQGLAAYPESSILLNNIGYSHYLAGDWSAAKRYYERALASDASNREAWSNLGLLYVRQARLEEAVHAFERIMEPANALNSVGYACMITGRYDCAKEYFSRAIAISPVYYEQAYANLGRMQRLLTSRE